MSRIDQREGRRHAVARQVAAAAPVGPRQQQPHSLAATLRRPLVGRQVRIARRQAEGPRRYVREIVAAARRRRGPRAPQRLRDPVGLQMEHRQRVTGPLARYGGRAAPRLLHVHLVLGHVGAVIVGVDRVAARLVVVHAGVGVQVGGEGEEAEAAVGPHAVAGHAEVGGLALAPLIDAGGGNRAADVAVAAQAVAAAGRVTLLAFREAAQRPRAVAVGPYLAEGVLVLGRAAARVDVRGGKVAGGAGIAAAQVEILLRIAGAAVGHAGQVVAAVGKG